MEAVDIHAADDAGNVSKESRRRAQVACRVLAYANLTTGTKITLVARNGPTRRLPQTCERFRFSVLLHAELKPPVTA